MRREAREGAAISVVHTWVHLFYTEPVPDWDTICSAHYFKLFCQVKQEKVVLSPMNV